MKLLIISLILFANSKITVFDFNTDNSIENWRIVDDRVMGGISQGVFELNDGNGHFHGHVTTESNGGFSSVRYRFDDMSVKNLSKAKLRVKGDGKRYQFRIKNSINDYHSYIQYFETSGDWETITINLEDMYPSFRGRKLNMSNFDHNIIQEVTFLIANYKIEDFSLMIDKIEFE